MPHSGRMKGKPLYPEFVAVKMSRPMRRRLEQAAAAEDRSVASYLRRLIATALGDPVRG